MTSIDTSLPDTDALKQVCAARGLNSAGAYLLHHRSNAVFLLPKENLIARLAPDTRLRRRRADTTITVTRWLTSQSPVVALPPADFDQPVRAAGAVATFWPYADTATTPTTHDLAAAVKQLHHLPHPPFDLPHFQPLERLQEALAIDRDRPDPVLTPHAHAWLAARTTQTLNAFAATEFPLGKGLIHGDAHGENMVCYQGKWVLIDWDHCCFGPRELDLGMGIPDHFHDPETQRTEFCTTYGYDPTRWPGWRLLRDLIELHALSSYIRLAASKPAAATELPRRITSLQTGDTTTVWRTVS